MAPEIIAGFLAIAALIVLQIVLFAYSYGKHTERLNNLDNRSIRLREQIEELNGQVGELCNKVTTVEVLLSKVFKLGNPDEGGQIPPLSLHEKAQGRDRDD